MSDALPVIESHVAAGEGWALSRGRDARTGAALLVVTLAAADLAAVRRGLAVAGSVGGRHLAEVVDAVALPEGGVGVVVAPPGGPRLAEVVAARGRLAAGEIVTLVAPLAATLAALQSRGFDSWMVCADTLWLGADGRPVLVPVLCERTDGSDDVMALAACAGSLLDESTPSAAAVGDVLRAAAGGRMDASRLVDAVMRAASASAISVAAPGATLHAHRRSPAARRSVLRHVRVGRARSVVAILGVTLIAVAVGALSGRHGGDAAVLAAPPLPVATRPVSSAPSWMSVMSTLESMRARAYANGDAALLEQVYAAGSVTGARDRERLRRMESARERAVGLQAFVQRIRVVAASGNRVTLRVTDALTAYDVVGSAGRVLRHGPGRPARDWTVVVVRTTAGWRIWTVRR